MPGPVSDPAPSIIEIIARDPCECHLPNSKRKWDSAELLLMGIRVCRPCSARTCLEEFDKFCSELNKEE